MICFTEMTALFIHQSIFIATYPLQVAGKVDPIPTDFRQEAWYTLDRSTIYGKANTEKNKNSHSPL